jgi:hypothetical protein
MANWYKKVKLSYRKISKETENREAKQGGKTGPVWGVVTSGKGGCIRWILWKYAPIPGMGEGIKENDGGGEFNYDTL